MFYNNNANLIREVFTTESSNYFATKYFSLAEEDSYFCVKQNLFVMNLCLFEVSIFRIKVYQLFLFVLWIGANVGIFLWHYYKRDNWIRYNYLKDIFMTNSNLEPLGILTYSTSVRQSCKSVSFIPFDQEFFFCRLQGIPYG